MTQEGEPNEQEMSSIIPFYLRDLTSILIAHVSMDGLLLDSNMGFLRTAGLPDEAYFVDVANVFLEPRFQMIQRLAARSSDTLIYEGLLNLGQESGPYSTVRGKIFHASSGILITAEHQVKDLEDLNKTLLELNEELVEQQRSVARLNHELKRKQEMLEVQSLTDPLTKVGNRRQLFQRLRVEMEQARQHQQPFSVIIGDIDHFKRINDTYGHQVGDRVLQATAQRLREGLRTHDFIGRYGGEEFMIVLPLASLEVASVIAERLRQGVAALAVSPLQEPITCSFGAATLEDETEEELLNRADVALYQSKQQGRNRVTLAERDS